MGPVCRPYLIKCFYTSALATWLGQCAASQSVQARWFGLGLILRFSLRIFWLTVSSTCPPSAGAAQ